MDKKKENAICTLPRQLTHWMDGVFLLVAWCDGWLTHSLDGWVVKYTFEIGCIYSIAYKKKCSETTQR